MSPAYPPVACSSIHVVDLYLSLVSRHPSAGVTELTQRAPAESAAWGSQAFAEQRTADEQVATYQLPACSAILAVFLCHAQIVPRPAGTKAGPNLHVLARVDPALGLQVYFAPSRTMTPSSQAAADLSIPVIRMVHRCLVLKPLHPAVGKVAGAECLMGLAARGSEVCAVVGDVRPLEPPSHSSG